MLPSEKDKHKNPKNGQTKKDNIKNHPKIFKKDKTNTKFTQTQHEIPPKEAEYQPFTKQ